MPIHTLMIGWEYPPAHCGGLGVACQGIVRGLLHHGARVTLVLPHDRGREAGVQMISPTAEMRAAQIIEVPSLLQPYDGPSEYRVRTELQTQTISTPDAGIRQLYGDDLLSEVERFTSSAVEMTQHIRADVVHTHDWMTLDAGVRVAKYHDRPLVAHVHATELDRTEHKPHQWIYDRERSGLLRADRVIAVSEYTKQLLIREYGIPEESITVVHNGTHEAPHDVSRPQRQKRHPLVLFLGRLTVQKGALYFLEAAKKIIAHLPETRFVIAGEGYLLPELIGKTCDMGLADSVIFAGKVKSDEAIALYRQADCFVMPSVSEPFGLVALEAITHGAPVVLSKQSGAAEVVRNALTVDFWDTEKMADCILTILREKPLSDQMRCDTPRILRHLTWNHQAEKLLTLYHSLTPV